MNDQTEKPETEPAADEVPSEQPMNRAERRHLKKHGDSADALREFRAQQARDSHLPHLPGPPVPGHKRSSIGRKTGS